MTTSTLWTTVKDEPASAARTARLSTGCAPTRHYRTPSDIDDLLAAVEDEDTPEAELIRGILSENARAYYSRHTLQRLTAARYRTAPARMR